MLEALLPLGQLLRAGMAVGLAAPPRPRRAAPGPVRLVLAEAPQKLTRLVILMESPPDFEQPSRTILWRRLDKAVEQGLVSCEGKGSKSDPFRYWLAQREAVWREDPFYALFE